MNFSWGRTHLACGVDPEPNLSSADAGLRWLSCESFIPIKDEASQLLCMRLRWYEALRSVKCQSCEGPQA
jgi:hypothetical protein